MAVRVDVAIAGGGVAGTALAVLLGRAGLGVALFEQHRYPREKACAEGLMPAGVRVLERMGLLDAVGGAHFAGVRYHGFGRVVEGEFPSYDSHTAYGVGQRRWRLDGTLAAAARTTPGVELHEGVRVEGPVLDRGRVAGLMVDGQPVPAALVVAADGPRSIVRRKAGLDARIRARRIGVRAHLALAPGQVAPQLVEVFVGAGHELYLTPLPDKEVSVALLTERDAIGDPRAALWRHIESHPALASRLEGARATGEVMGQTPLESRARRGSMPGLVLLGDDAGFVDPVTGAGMAQALMSAELLAARLIGRRGDGFDPSAAAMRSYDRRRRTLLRDSVLLTRLVRALATRPALAAGTLALMAASPRLYRHLIGTAGGTRRLLRPW